MVHVLLVAAIAVCGARTAAAQGDPAPDSTAPAAIPADPPPDRWDVSAELSLSDQSGNRSLRLWTAGLRFAHRIEEDFELEGSLSSRYGRSEGEVVTRNHYGSLNFDFRPKARWSPFFYADAERDPFKRLVVRFSGGTGAKYTPYRAARGPGELSTSLALLHSYEHFTSTEADPHPDVRWLARWSLRVRGTRSLRDGVTLSHTSHYQPQWSGLADYLLRTETGVKVLLNERLALTAEHSLNRSARPPEGVEPNDRLFKTGIIIAF